jgi:mRNA interferase MazF
MKRGDIVAISLSGDYGKPRPAVIIQADFFDIHPSVTVLPITSELRDAPLFRIDVEPNEVNGLQKKSQIMVDKAHTVAREKVKTKFGKLSDTDIVKVNRALAVFLGFA